MQLEHIHAAENMGRSITSALQCAMCIPHVGSPGYFSMGFFRTNCQSNMSACCLCQSAVAFSLLYDFSLQQMFSLSLLYRVHCIVLPKHINNKLCSLSLPIGKKDHIHGESNPDNISEQPRRGGDSATRSTCP